MKGILANRPAARSLDGKSGMTPSCPSITGVNKNCSGKEAAVSSHALRSVLVLAVLEQEKVSSWDAVAHEGTLETNVSHTTSRRAGSKTGSVFAEPDSKI